MTRPRPATNSRHCSPSVEEVSGPTHPDTLTARADLARFTGEAGDPAAARDQYTALLPIREEVSGPTHPDTLSARADLARFTGEAGDPAAARDQYTALLPIREEVSRTHGTPTPSPPGRISPASPGRRVTRSRPATSTRRCSPPVEEVSGPRHPDTLSARADLARFTGAAGDPVAARDQYTALLPTLRRSLGPTHPDTLAARADLAHWTALASGSE